jgi:phosphomannomutase
MISATATARAPPHEMAERIRLDGTLAESKGPLSAEMAATLTRLLAVIDVAVISGGDWPQFDWQVASRLPFDAASERLWLMATTGTKLYRFVDDACRAIYTELFDDEEKTSIRAALDRALSEARLAYEHIWGERIEDREAKSPFSSLGQDAPLEAKQGWDPDRAKRTALQKTPTGGAARPLDQPWRHHVDRRYPRRRRQGLWAEGAEQGSGVPLAGMLYRSTDSRCRRGAPVANLAHSASFHSLEKITPSRPGIKYLDASCNYSRNPPPSTGRILQLKTLR